MQIFGFCERPCTVFYRPDSLRLNCCFQHQNIAYHLPPLSAPTQHPILKDKALIIRPQSLTAQYNLPSFCVKLSKRILSQCFGLFFMFQNTHWFILDTAERVQHLAGSVRFVCCSPLAVCCSWFQHLLTAADVTALKRGNINEDARTQCFLSGSLIENLLISKLFTKLQNFL